MIYLANPCTAQVVDAMVAGELGYIDTPGQGNTRPPGVTWCADNGAFSDKWDQHKWWRFLEDNAPAAATCLFAVAPDVVGDAWRTHIKAYDWLPKIRALGYPAAYVAQNGIEKHPMMPWPNFDVLFIGGCRECPVHGPTHDPIKEGGSGGAARYYCPECRRPAPEWKLGPVVRELVVAAKNHGKHVHMGRVNSRKRYEYARSIGCDSADGTFLTRGPDKRLPELLGWVRSVQHAHPPLFGGVR